MTVEKRPPWEGPIGIFDSGIGGLTVAAAVRRLLVEEDIFYLGDTARVPYGGKSRETVERYSLEICGLLLAEGAKAIVVACNTASALALERLRQVLRVPVLGVVEPGANAAASTTKSDVVGVMATRSTVRSGAYERALLSLNERLRIVSQECPLLVPLIEEGWLEDPVTDAVLQRYCSPLRAAGADTVVLGCTHYPLIAPAIQRALPGAKLVDSAENTASVLRDTLELHGLRTPPGIRTGRLRVAFTDAGHPFLHIVERELRLPLGEVEYRRVQGVAAL